MITSFAEVQYAIGMPGPMELFIILMIVLVVFGAKKIPDIGEGLGKGIKNFRKSFEKDEQITSATPTENKAIPASSQPSVDEQYAESKDHQS